MIAVTPFFGNGLLLSLYLTLAIQLNAASPKQKIDEVLTQDQFRKSGLHRLSAEELTQLSGALYGWVEPEESSKVVVTPQPKPSPNEAASFGQEHLERDRERNSPSPPKDDASIRSRIKGTFSGWNGSTVFRLENGQVWRQIDRSEFVLRREDPTIVIEKGLFSAYFLSVEGHGSRCKVKRVK